MLLGQVGENGNIDPVLNKAVSVLGHAEFFGQSEICCIAGTKASLRANPFSDPRNGEFTPINPL
jgi:hypothetical protein